MERNSKNFKVGDNCSTNELMTRKIKFIILIVFIASIVTYLDWKISTDLDFHSGKDGGLFYTFESILLLGSLFFVVMAKIKRILFIFLGFFGSLFCSIVVYLVLGFSNLIDNLPFHIISCLSFIALFFYLEKLFTKSPTTAKTQ
ncbi:hypothetical protein FLFR108385_12225 [Flavobacterium frigoris]